MYNSVVFYNHFGAGDIFESREFIKDYMKDISAEKYYYAHGKDPIILRDIDYLGFTEVTEAMHPMKDVTFIGNDLYINTWIGRDGGYVLPGIGCVVEQLYRMHNDIRKKLGINLLQRDVYDYIPDIDYNKYSIYPVMDFIKSIKNSRGQIVLISNGNAQSNQAFNFDMSIPICLLCEAYHDSIFITTSRTNFTYPNLYYTGDVLQLNRFDLNEISYLSTFCDTIIGRNSGPDVFCQVKKNWTDPNKALLSFTYQRIASTFVSKNDFPMKKYWSNAQEPVDAYLACLRAFNRSNIYDYNF